MRIYDIIDRLTLIFLLFSASFCLLSYSVAEDVSIQQSKGSKALFTTENTSLSNISDINNVSAKENISGSVTEPSTIESSFEEINNEKFSQSEFMFADVASQNSGLSNEFVDTGQAAIFTLSDAATTELQQRAELPVEPSQNATPNLISNTSASETPTEPDTPQKNLTSPHQHEDETHRSEEISQEQHDNPKTEQLEEAIELKTEEIAVENVTGRNEEIPSFSEWAQRQMEEAEKKKDVVNSSLHVNGGNGKGNNFKLRSKNYASLDCGAKIVAANPEAVSAGAVLSSSRDEYKLNACQNRIWFIVELCEAIQAKKIDLANFELFSSSPKDFSVYVSDRFPSRDWLNVGHFTAKDERDIQSFDLDPQLFGKFVKVEMHSHHGSEHFCPISLFRVYGTSEFEVLEKENQAHASDDDDEDETLDSDNGQAPKNLFTSATDAVISIVKKAAEVLGNKQNSSNFTIEADSKDAPQLINSCTTPSHLIVCDNCSDTLFGEVYELISCKASNLFRLIQSEIIKKTMYHTDTCTQYGLDFRSKRTTYSKLSNQFIRTIFPRSYIAALCNTAAVLENKVVLNVSKQFPNVTKEIPKELHVPEKIIPPPVVLNKSEEVQPTEQLTVEKIQLATAAPSDVNATYASQIKPTKTLAPENNINTHLTPETKDEKTVQPAEQPENKTADAEVDENNNLEFEAATESSEDIELINELNNLGVIQNPPMQQTTPHVKESVFLRLSNRIKALERNMSLSSQYLEELSRRYKKQVEEMQRLLDKTLNTLNEESRTRDEHNKKLEAKIGELSTMVQVLLEEKNSWVKMTSFLVLTFGILFGIFTFCRRVERAKQSGDPPPPKIQRRKSIDVLNHNTPPKKTRRPSDEIITSRTYKDLMRSESDVKKKVKERKKKKKKAVVIGRSSSFDALTEENTDTEFEYHRYVNSDTSVQIRPHSRGWNRMDSAPGIYSIDWDSTQGGTDIEDVPFVLEESDISPLELPMQPIESVDKSNGNGVPSYVRTASEVRLKRKSSTNGVSKEIYRKGVSLDETGRQPSPSLSSDASSAHNSVEDVKNKGPSPKKDRKAAIKRMLKKVF